jgi:hypothetical protein
MYRKASPSKNTLLRRLQFFFVSLESWNYSTSHHLLMISSHLAIYAVKFSINFEILVTVPPLFFLKKNLINPVFEQRKPLH